MNNKVNYQFVGFFVLLSFCMLTSFSYWMMKPKDSDEMKKYLILFDESILGLHIDSAVKYRGIDVGKVVKIRINPKNIEQVEVQISILKTTPIKETTMAKLTSQGITGLSYINLNLGDNSSPFLTRKEGEQYAVIKTIPSLMENIENSMGSVSTKFSKVLSKTEQLLNEENQHQISLLLKSTVGVMSRFEKILNEKDIAHLHNILKSSDSITNKIDTLIPKLDILVENSTLFEKDFITNLHSIATSYLSVRSTMLEAEKALHNDEFNIKKITQNTIPHLNNNLIEMENLIIQLEAILKTYEKSPGDILFKTEEIKKGPGEI